MQVQTPQARKNEKGKEMVKLTNSNEFQNFVSVSAVILHWLVVINAIMLLKVLWLPIQ